MTAYYYVAASLPFLSAPDQMPPVSTEYVLDICSRFMKSADYDDIAQITLNPENSGSGGLTLKYGEWERSLRNQLVYLRAKNAGLDPCLFVRPGIEAFGTAPIAAQAMNQSTPLEAEIFLNQHRWAKIDDLAIGHFFDMEFLRGYRLKLLLLERCSMFNEEKGFIAYQNIYQRVLDASGENQK